MTGIRCLCWLLLLFMALPAMAEDFVDAQVIYQLALQQAASGHDDEAVNTLNQALQSPFVDGAWRERLVLAAGLLEMKAARASQPVFAAATPQTRMVEAYLTGHAAPRQSIEWAPALLGAVIPGAGHLWLGRYHDAAISAILVVPMLLLTFWAARRKMGPVTVFFFMITAWLWSGTVFSVYSLTERTFAEAYLGWWQGVWQAAALPGLAG